MNVGVFIYGFEKKCKRLFEIVLLGCGGKKMKVN